MLSFQTKSTEDSLVCTLINYYSDKIEDTEAFENERTREARSKFHGLETRMNARKSGHRETLSSN